MDQLDSPAGSRDPTLPQAPRATAGQSLNTRVSKARHDLRNPLIYILGFGEILQEEALAAGHRQLIPDFHAVHEAAAHVFAEVNHCLNLDNIKSEPENIRKLHQAIQVYSEKIITLTESLSEKCDTLENNSFGDDLLRITGSARQLQTLAPALLDSLVDVEPSQVTAMESAATASLIQQTGVASLLPHPSGGTQPLLGTLLVVDD